MTLQEKIQKKAEGYGEWRWLGKDSYTNWMSIPELLK